MPDELPQNAKFIAKGVQAPPDLEFVAKQLRQPSGDAATQFAANMDVSNEVLYDLTLEEMDLQPEQRILEIGFGSGSFVHKLFDKVDSLKVDGLDLSADMVKLAGSKNQALIDSGKLSLAQGSSDQLPFADSTFDKVFCNMVIFFWDQPGDHLKEVLRVLKPDGKFYSGFRTKKTMAVMPFTKFGFNLYEPNDWQQILEQNGFRVAKTEARLDPKIVDGPPVQLESVCVTAVKA